MHPGTQQDQRLARALQPGYISPDELSLAQRLRLTLAQARQLRFIDAQGHESGHWGEALEQDLSLLLAELAAFPIDEREQALLAELGQQPEGAAQWKPCLALVAQLDAWLHALEAQAEHSELLTPLRRGLQARLQEELGPLLQHAPKDAQPAARLHPLWKTASDQATRTLSSRELMPRQLALALCRCIRQLGEQAARLLPESLRSGRHDPALGLLLAFVQLLQRSRAPLNQFADRLTEHYYRERLGLRPHPGEGDRIHVLMERDPRHAKPVRLPAGSRLICGRSDSGQARIYLSEQALELGTLKVESLLTLRLEGDPLISPERELGYATTARATRIHPPSPDQAAQARAPSWPLLGGGEGPGCVDAEQGLALASPLLQLGEGERAIELSLLLSHPLDHDGLLKQLLEQPRHSRSWLYRVLLRLAAHEARSGGAAASWCADRGQRLPRQQALAAPARRERLALLRLAQRQRRFALACPWLAYLLLRCLQADSAAALQPRLGRLFAVWLCHTEEDFHPGPLRALQSHARRLFKGQPGGPLAIDNPLVLVFGQRRRHRDRQPPQRELILDRVLRGLWQLRLSSTSGWLSLDEVHTSATPAAENGHGRGLRLRLRLAAGQPPLCACQPELHGAQWPALPVLQLRMRGGSRLFGASLLQQLVLERVLLRVSVQGQRQLLLHNQLGRLDPSKPFLPFGPLPDSASYLLFSSAEIAAKPLDALSLQLRWAGLPAAGLAAHYAGYPEGPWQRDSFSVSLALLSGARWCSAQVPTLALFGPGPEVSLQLDSAELSSLHHPSAPPPGQAAEYSLASRHGFFKLQLASPAQGFGHALYPRLLTEVLTRNARFKRNEPLPNPPYTPTLEQISLSYQSSEQLSLRSDAEPARALRSSLWRIGPFGQQPLRASTEPCPLLLPWADQGQLFIGLGGDSAQGLLNLLFQLKREAAREALGRPALQLRWAAWCGAQGWVPLEPHRILQDHTQGMLRTGLVIIELPAGMSRDCPAMPAGLFWLRLSASGELERLAPLQGVWAQAISARAEQVQQPEARLGRQLPLPAHSATAVEPAVSGLLALRQPQPGFDLRGAEDVPTQRCRIAERLHHRQRASTPWDYERLVLQAFPEVFKLKCMPQRSGGDYSGQVLVVVVPALPAGFEPDGTEAPRLDAATLQAISDYLLERSAPGVRLLVRNAGYERIQVRCALRLARGSNSGERLRELHQALRDYLSPWRPGGITADFDWRLGADEVEAMLRAQPGVEAVGQVSLLHIVRADDGHYRLVDSARQSGSRSVTPAFRWSLALPMRQHLMSLDERPGALGPQPTGLAKLALGANFIIGRRSA